MQAQGCVEINGTEAFALLQTLEDVHILIHRSPDGDCVGGGYALYHILKQMGIRSRVLCADPIPEVFQDITNGITFEDFEAKAHISVDVADRKLFGSLPEEEKNSEILLCIDHHISNTHYANKLFYDPEASAACEVLFYLMQQHDLPLTPEIALCLYIGMSTDTGCFQFSNAGADTFAAVAQIKRAYPELPYARLNRELFVLKSPGRIRLDTELMQNIRLSEGGKTALIYLPHRLMETYGLTPDEVEGVANLPMQITGVQIGITVKEQEDGSYRISLRGDDRSETDVSAIAHQFGGGGHLKASGCFIQEGEPEAVCKRLIDTAEEIRKGWS